MYSYINMTTKAEHQSRFYFIFCCSVVLFKGEIDKEKGDLQFEDLVTNPCLLHTTASSTLLPTW